VLTVTTQVWRQRFARPYLLTGWLWFLGTLVPVIGLIQVGQQAIADRYAYIPLIGILVMMVWGAAS
jgi:protein O-mannosyl-transferase